MVSTQPRRFVGRTNVRGSISDLWPAVTRLRHDTAAETELADLRSFPIRTFSIQHLGVPKMKLRLGQAVHATDGPFGDLRDIIVDPIAKTVTHIVAEPHHQQQQARLVPISLVSEVDHVLTVGLDANHIRQLERVSYSDYLEPGQALEVGDAWDIGTQEVFSAPYHNIGIDMGWGDRRIGVSYDRIPKGECEIRRTSQVISSDAETVGAVHGMVADDSHIKAIIVRSGLPGFRHDTLVPLGSVKAVRIDQIDLTLTEEQFDLLPRTDLLSGSDDDFKAHMIDLRRRAEAAGGTLASTGRALATSAKGRLQHRS